jgi:chromosome segregation ATPase
MSSRTFILVATGALVCVAAGGCASQGGPKPTEELTKARSVVEQADKGNAQRYAAADLQRAHDELNSADRAITEKKYKDALAFAQRAQVDADLANARGNSGEAQKSAQEVTQGIDTLKQESQRGDNSAPRN